MPSYNFINLIANEVSSHDGASLPHRTHPAHVPLPPLSHKNRSKSPLRRSATPQADLPSPSHHSTNSKLTSLQGGHYDFRVGEEMGGYRVTRQLGEGTFGRVVEAQRKGRKFAIKVEH